MIGRSPLREYSISGLYRPGERRQRPSAPLPFACAPQRHGGCPGASLSHGESRLYRPVRPRLLASDRVFATDERVSSWPECRGHLRRRLTQASPTRRAGHNVPSRVYGALARRDVRSARSCERRDRAHDLVVVNRPAVRATIGSSSSHRRRSDIDVPSRPARGGARNAAGVAAVADPSHYPKVTRRFRARLFTAENGPSSRRASSRRRLPPESPPT